MRKILFAAVALFAGSFMSMAQEVKTLDDYSEVRFYGIDFAPVKVVAANETESEFIDAFGKINNLFLTEPDKYILALEDRLKRRLSMWTLTMSSTRSVLSTKANSR